MTKSDSTTTISELIRELEHWRDSTYGQMPVVVVAEIGGVRFGLDLKGYVCADFELILIADENPDTSEAFATEDARVDMNQLLQTPWQNFAERF